jgi:hypothetical protein
LEIQLLSGTAAAQDGCKFHTEKNASGMGETARQIPLSEVRAFSRTSNTESFSLGNKMSGNITEGSCELEGDERVQLALY